MSATSALLTVPNLKRFEASPETKALRLAVFEAMARAIVTRELVDGYTAPILERFAFVADARNGGKPITKAGDLYLTEDCAPQISAKLEAFYAELDAEAKAHGFELPAGYCPALVAETAQRDAERALLEHAETFLGMGGVADSWGDIRERALGLFLSGAKP